MNEQALAFAIGVATGILMGSGLTIVICVAALRIATRYVATGAVDAPPAPVANEIMPTSAEASASKRIAADVLERGADQLAEAYRESGMPVPKRSQLKIEAARMAESADPLGGAR